MNNGTSDAAMRQERRGVGGSAGKQASAAKPKVAIVCDWLTGTGGAERVVLEMHKLYPEAPIYTSQYDKRAKVWYGQDWFADADVRTGWLQRLPKFLKKFLPVFRGWYFSRLDLDEYDLVISSSGAEAKFVKTKGLHITYCHAPTHYYWSRYDDYLQNPGFGWLNPLARLGLKLLVGPMRRWDYRAAQRPDYFVANSRHTKAEIKKYYGRDATVVHPPVEVERFAGYSQPALKRHGFVAAGRQTPYKRIDLAVKAATEADVPLLVVGTGPDQRKLQKIAGDKVVFLRQVSDEQLPEIFGGAKGFIFAGVDDFGIVAVEALAAGTPVIAYREGGALDYVNNSTGLFFDKQDSSTLANVLKQANEKTFNHEAIARSAKKYSATEFRKNLKQFVSSTLKKGAPKK